jgi:hypothetical protein
MSTIEQLHLEYLTVLKSMNMRSYEDVINEAKRIFNLCCSVQADQNFTKLDELARVTKNHVLQYERNDKDETYQRLCAFYNNYSKKYRPGNKKWYGEANYFKEGWQRSWREKLHQMQEVKAHKEEAELQFAFEKTRSVWELKEVRDKVKAKEDELAEAFDKAKQEALVADCLSLLRGDQQVEENEQTGEEDGEESGEESEEED